MTIDNDTNLGLYLADISKIPLLTEREEYELARRAKGGDTLAIEALTRANLRFVVKIAKIYSRRLKGQASLLDLIQEGNLGLMEAVKNFDFSRGFRFTTYAAYWIKQYIQRAYRSKYSMIRLPIRRQEALDKVKKRAQQFYMEMGQEPKIEDLLDDIDLTPKQIEMLSTIREPALPLESRLSDESKTISEVLIDPESMDPQDEAAARQLQERIEKVFGFLSPTEREIIKMRFGFEGGQRLSLRKIGKIVGLSQERVRCIERRALEKLRRPSIRAYLEGFF